MNYFVEVNPATVRCKPNQSCSSTRTWQTDRELADHWTRTNERRFTRLSDDRRSTDTVRARLYESPGC